MFGLESDLTILLILCLVVACAFEFINGFHDTANAVATVIYTHSLKPGPAVIWSGICNFIGVNVGGIAVAVGIINLLPTEMLVDQNVYHGIAMILALLFTAIIWNLGTWYFGIPCSSSHTLIGSIFGVGLGYMMLPGTSHVSLNWGKISDVGLSLLVSPLFGFGLAMLLMYLLRVLIKNKTIFKEPQPKKKPPLWIRSILLLTCTSVSFSHGSNDGQKGVGLIMIILIGIVPYKFAIDHSKNPYDLKTNVHAIEHYVSKIDTTQFTELQAAKYAVLTSKLNELQVTVDTLSTFQNLPKDKNFGVRQDLILISKSYQKLHTDDHPVQGLSKTELAELKYNISQARSYTEYSPWWVILMISISLGLGTMVGWKRIVVTIGEKIGKTHLSYAQGACAEIVAASTIGASTWLGLPVSTTHVLSSGVAGSMAAGGGLKNLQAKTIRNIGIAWLVTLPVTILLSMILFFLLRLIMG